MRIGINVSFLRKPGTGIAQVTLHFLKTLSEMPNYAGHSFVLYLDEPVGTCDWPKNFEQKIFLPWWWRDDVPRKWLWEKKLAQAAQNDGCEAFLSLYQSATVLPRNFPHTMIVHDVIPWLFPEYQSTLSRKLYYRSVRKGMQEASQIIAVSEKTREDLCRFRIAPNKVTIAYPSVNPLFSHIPGEKEVLEVLRKYGIEPGYIYHGGGLEIRKNAETLLRAYKKLCDENDEEKSLPKLVISGRIFPESNRLATPVKRLIRELGLEERVALLDFVPETELVALYSQATMFVYPSLYEGFGLPVLEALSVGAPVITSRVSSLPEVGGEAVLYVDPKNTNELALAMEKLLKNDALRQELISKSRKQALQFSWRSFTDKIMSTLLDS